MKDNPYTVKPVVNIDDSASYHGRIYADLEAAKIARMKRCNILGCNALLNSLCLIGKAKLWYDAPMMLEDLKRECYYWFEVLADVRDIITVYAVSHFINHQVMVCDMAHVVMYIQDLDLKKEIRDYLNELNELNEAVNIPDQLQDEMRIQWYGLVSNSEFFLKNPTI